MNTDEYRCRALLDQMRRRWPRIAAAAEHPLTEMLAHRSRRRLGGWALDSSGVAAILCGLAAGAIALTLYSLPEAKLIWQPAFIFGPFVAVGAWIGRGLRLSGATAGGGMARLLSRKENLLEIWMTPLGAPEMLAIEAAGACLSPRRPAGRRLGYGAFCASWVAAQLLCLALGLGPGSLLAGALFDVGILTAVITTLRLTDDERLVFGQISLLAGVLGATDWQGRKRQLLFRRAGRRGAVSIHMAAIAWALGCFLLGCLLLFTIRQLDGEIGNADGAFILFGMAGLLFAAAFAFIETDWHSMGDFHFEEKAVGLEERYRKLVREIAEEA
ncbi:MAG: hypothetical protein NTW86_32965 [Candidatus Sumerlaeota bacterium]|nr:hypothetical protein [Candidatus Sumerlaeota bacterium]